MSIGSDRHRDPDTPVRIEDLAQHLGMSPATVSMALRDVPGPSQATKERVRAAAALLRYRPDRAASMLAAQRRDLLGVILEIKDPFHADLVENMYEAAADRGYDLVLSMVTRARSEARAMETLLDSRCGVAILLGPHSGPSSWGSAAGALPLIVVGGKVRDSMADVVRTADDVGVGLAVTHLVGLGHRNIVYVDAGIGPVAKERRHGYRKAMRKHGLSEFLQVVSVGRNHDSVIEFVDTMATSPTRPTGLATSDDACAVSLLDALSRINLPVPEALSVVGYDDGPLARLPHANLTSISQDPAGQARQAVAIAIDRLSDPHGEPREIVLAPHLVLRGSTAAPQTLSAPGLASAQTRHADRSQR